MKNPTRQKRIVRGLAVAVLATCALAACQQSQDATTAVEPVQPPARSASAAVAAASAGRPAAAQSSSHGVQPFTVEVTLSDKARATFDKSGESVIVAAAYFASPKPGIDPRDVDEIGQVDLGRREIELPGAGTARFDGRAVAKDKLGLIADAPQVNINVYSGRKTSDDNLLNCDMFQDSVKLAASKPIQLHCALLTEPYATKAFTPSASSS